MASRSGSVMCGLEQLTLAESGYRYFSKSLGEHYYHILFFLVFGQARIPPLPHLHDLLFISNLSWSWCLWKSNANELHLTFTERYIVSHLDKALYALAHQS